MGAGEYHTTCCCSPAQPKPSRSSTVSTRDRQRTELAATPTCAPTSRLGYGGTAKLVEEPSTYSATGARDLVDLIHRMKFTFETPTLRRRLESRPHQRGHQR